MLVVAVATPVTIVVIAGSLVSSHAPLSSASLDGPPPRYIEPFECFEDPRRCMRAQGHRPPPVLLSLATLAPSARLVRSVRCARPRASWTRALGAVRERRPTRRAVRAWEREDSARDSAAGST